MAAKFVHGLHVPSSLVFVLVLLHHRAHLSLFRLWHRPICHVFDLFNFFGLGRERVLGNSTVVGGIRICWLSSPTSLSFWVRFSDTHPRGF